MKLIFKKSWMIVVFLFGATVFARPPEEGEFLAAALLGEDIADWILDLDSTPSSIGVFSVYAYHPFEQDFANIVEIEILKNLSKRGLDKVTSCTECRAPQVTVAEERLIIRKGAPDLETLRKIGARQPVESFLVVDIYRAKLSIICQATLYQNPTGMVIAAQRFRIPALTVSDAAVQFLATFGMGRVLGASSSSSGSSTSSTSSQLATAINVSLLEEVGFGKAGANVGFVLSPSSGTMIYFNPTLAFRGRFGTSGLAWSLNLGFGYGFTTSKGIVVRGAYEVYLGSFAVTGFEGVYLLPQDGTTSPFSGFAGIHFGISLGR